MIRKNIRLRREYLYTKENEKKEIEQFVKKQKNLRCPLKK